MFKYHAEQTEKSMIITLSLNIGIEHTDEFPLSHLIVDDKDPKVIIKEKFHVLEIMQLDLAAKQIERMKEEICRNLNVQYAESSTNEKLH